jgi:spermidine/putrescine transport system permease protein
LTRRVAKSAQAPRRRAIPRLLLTGYAGLVYVFLYAPIAMIVLLSFNTADFIGFPIEGLGLVRYREAVASSEVLHAAINSVLLGMAAASIATVLALGLALGFRYRFPLKGVVLQMILVPIVIPAVVGGVVLMVLFGYAEVSPGLWTTVLVAHVNWALPFAFLTLYPRVHRFDRSLEEAAMDLGARPALVLRRVVLPMMRPGIVATFLFSFTLSFDEFVRTLFVIGSDRTIPVLIWTLVIERNSPHLPAVGVLIMAATIVIALIAFVTGERSRSAS